MKQTQNWRLKLAKFMKGRYGYFDSLNRMMMILAIILVVIPLSALSWGAYLLIIIAYYRYFSKKIYVRSNENQKYLAIQNKVFRRFNNQKEAFKNRKESVYFRCPECKQQLRAPRGKGKIKVTCSKCQHQFVKKV
jgi:hypothetical protein